MTVRFMVLGAFDRHTLWLIVLLQGLIKIVSSLLNVICFIYRTLTMRILNRPHGSEATSDPLLNYLIM